MEVCGLCKNDSQINYRKEKRNKSFNLKESKRLERILEKAESTSTEALTINSQILSMMTIIDYKLLLLSLIKETKYQNI